MVIEQTEQPLPFVVEPLSPARAKLWGKFASQVCTQSEINIIRAVHNTFWYDLHSYSIYEHALTHVEGAASGILHHVECLTGWLDSLAATLCFSIKLELEVLLDLQRTGGDEVSPRHYKDVNDHIASSTRLLADVRQFGVAVCEEFGLAIPESFVEQSTSPTVQAAGEGVEGVASL